MSPVNSEANETEEQAARPSIRRAWYRTSVGVAIIGGVFSLVVCVLLLSNHLHIKTSDPLNSKKLNDLRASLLRQPGDDSIKEQIRALDLQLRTEYFRRREFSRRGSYLLIGGISVFLMGVKYAVKYRERLPVPQPIREDESRNARLARWSVGIFGATIGGIALVFSILGTGYRIPDSGIQHPASNIQTYPSQGEIKRNWPRFRGPGGLGTSAYTNIPSSWNGNTGEGIIWKTPIPLPGVNSPIVWDERVFLTGADEERREIYCFDAKSGEMLWQRAVENIPFSSPEPPEVSEDTGFAAPTAATDGQRVYAIFANGDLVCFDLDGKQIWGRNVGPFDNMYGYASSLAMYKNLLLVLLDQGEAEDDLSELIAVEATTGRTIWSAHRPVPNSWASPIVIDNGEREEIITCGSPWVIAYEPTTGKELWRAECLGGDVAPSPIYVITGRDARTTGLVFVTNAYEVLAAIRLGGQGDVTDTHIVWTAEDGLPDICSPLSNGELVFLLETYGLLTCYDAKNGAKAWEEDLVETFKASPSLVGDRIYLMTEDGIMIIIKADREFKEIGRCELGEAVNASPAFMDGRIYIRGEENLYCIANAPK